MLHVRAQTHHCIAHIHRLASMVHGGLVLQNGSGGRQASVLWAHLVDAGSAMNGVGSRGVACG